MKEKKSYLKYGWGKALFSINRDKAMEAKIVEFLKSHGYKIIKKKPYGEEEEI